ncbi:MAG: DUF354 domain-containing protein, partial [Candidatus Sifarchaeia archaeon]
LRVLVDIGHPAHVHLMKHIIWRIEDFGGKVCITTRQKDVATDLLDAYGFRYHIVGQYSNLIDKSLSLFNTTYKLLKIAQEFNPHSFLSCGSVHAAPVARILNRMCITLVDTEGSIVQGLVVETFSNRIYTPEVFRRNLGKNHIRYNGFHEMAYLLPKYFKPNVNVLSKYGLDKEDTFFIVRIVSWKATHDWGQSGIADLPSLVKYLKKFGKVILSMESDVSSNLKDYTMRIAPEDMHSMLAYARAYVGEGATMASESISLGTPSVYLNSQIAGTIDAEQEAGLLYHIIPSNNMDDRIQKTIDQIMATPTEKFRARGRKFISNKIDVVDFIFKELLDSVKAPCK